MIDGGVFAVFANNDTSVLQFLPPLTTTTDEAAEIIKEMADPEANIIFGTVIDERMGDDLQITVIATGFDHNRANAYPGLETEADIDSLAALQARMLERAALWLKPGGVISTRDKLPQISYQTWPMAAAY